MKKNTSNAPDGGVASPPMKKVASPPLNKVVASPPIKRGAVPPPLDKNVTSSSVLKNVSSPPFDKSVTSPPVLKSVTSPPFDKNVTSPPVLKSVTSPPFDKSVTTPPIKKEIVSSPPKKDIVSPPPKKEVTSPPVAVFKLNRTDSKGEENSFVPKAKKEPVAAKDVPVKAEKLSLVTNSNEVAEKVKNIEDSINVNSKVEETNNEEKLKEESNGVGDKIKKFEKAAEDASASVGRLSRPGSVRGRPRTERIGSDSKEDLPPPATPFKDNIHFELSSADKTPSVESQHGNSAPTLEKQQNLTKNHTNVVAVKWQRSESSSLEEKPVQKPEPQKIIKPEFKPMASPVDVTVRSPSLGAKIPDQFPSHGTAFRNVASPDPARSNVHKFNDDVNTQNNFKTCKFKNKEKYSVSKGSSYFTRGSEEIWLVKKKDIEEIEERVLDSFRRAGGNLCMRSESMRPSSDSGQSVSFTHATMGRNKRQMYARSESLDPQWAGARAQTLKRQTSVACTCGHDKKTRAKSAAADTTPRPRSRSHGDDNNQAHVLDKYETLV